MSELNFFISLHNIIKTMFSKSCEYGIKAVIYIAQQSLKNKRVRLGDIAKAINSPVAFTAKTLQLLAREKIIHSVMGKAGGYLIETNKLEKINLSQIVKAIDGETIYNGCGLGLEGCNELAPCPIHNEFKQVREKLKLMLINTTIKDLALSLDSGLAYLKRISLKKEK